MKKSRRNMRKMPFERALNWIKGGRMVNGKRNT